MKKQFLFLSIIILTLSIFCCLAYSFDKKILNDDCGSLANQAVAYYNFYQLNDYFTAFLKNSISNDSTMFSVINPYQEAYALYQVNNPISANISIYALNSTTVVKNDLNSYKLDFNNSLNSRLLCSPANNSILLNDSFNNKYLLYDSSLGIFIAKEGERLDNLYYWGVNVLVSDNGEKYSPVKNIELNSQSAAAFGYMLQNYSVCLPENTKFVKIVIADVFSLTKANNTPLSSRYSNNIRLADVKIEYKEYNISSTISSSVSEQSAIGSSSDIDLNTSASSSASSSKSKSSSSSKSTKKTKTASSKSKSSSSSEKISDFIQNSADNNSNGNAQDLSVSKIDAVKKTQPQSSSVAEQANKQNSSEVIEVKQNEDVLRYLRAENNISTIAAAYATSSACYLTLSLSYLINKYVRTNMIEIIKKLFNK